MNQCRQKNVLENMMKEPSAGKRIGIVRLHMIKEDRTLYGMRQFSQPREAAEMVRPLFSLADREMMAVMSLTTQMEPLALEIAAVGGINSCLVDIRNIFKHSLLNNASYVLCFHNHPSGNPEPSTEDRRITGKIYGAGQILGIELVDHIIIGKDAFYSFREHGEIKIPQTDPAFSGYIN